MRVAPSQEDHILRTAAMPAVLSCYLSKDCWMEHVRSTYNRPGT